MKPNEQTSQQWSSVAGKDLRCSVAQTVHTGRNAFETIAHDSIADCNLFAFLR
jgi:hypothetical protein